MLTSERINKIIDLFTELRSIILSYHIRGYAERVGKEEKVSILIDEIVYAFEELIEQMPTVRTCEI